MHVLETDILLYIDDKLPAGDRLTLERHVGRCNDCASRFATLVRLPQVLNESIPIQIDNEVLVSAVEIVRVKEQVKRWHFRFFDSPLRIAFGGAAVAVIVLTTYLLAPKHEPAQFRSTDTATPLLRLFPPDGAKVAGPHPVFHWSSVARSSVYNFSLMDERGVSVWNWDVRDTSLVLPSTVVLLPGKTYLWRVESFLADKSLERSALHVFTYAPSQ